MLFRSVAFQYRNAREIRRREMLGLTLLVHNGLVSALFATIPLLLQSFELSLASVWQISSSLAIANYFLMAYLWIKRLVNSDIKNKLALRFYYSLFVPNLIIVPLLVMNVFGIIFEQEFGPFLLALVWPLMIAGIIFAQLILAPLWRSVFKAEREAKELAEEESLKASNSQ